MHKLEQEQKIDKAGNAASKPLDFEKPVLLRTGLLIGAA